MTQQAQQDARDAISATEQWLVDRCEELLNPAGTPQGKKWDVDSGPGEWSEAYLRRILKCLPAVRVVWEGGPAQEGAPLTLDMRWTIYVVTGWRGETDFARRRGTATRIGANRACALLAPLLHCDVIPTVDGDGNPLGGGQIHITGMQNLWSGDLDKVGVAVYGIALEVAVPLDADEDRLPVLNDFLRAGIDWDLPGVGEEVDASEIFDVRGGS